MKYDFQDVKERIAELSGFIVQVQKDMHSDRTIRISCQHGCPRYYLSQYGGKEGGIYLGKDRVDTVREVIAPITLKYLRKHSRSCCI